MIAALLADISPALWGLNVVISLVFAFACNRIAVSKGRGPVLWAILGFFFSLISLIVILVLPRKR